MSYGSKKRVQFRLKLETAEVKLKTVEEELKEERDLNSKLLKGKKLTSLGLGDWADRPFLGDFSEFTVGSV